MTEKGLFCNDVGDDDGDNVDDVIIYLFKCTLHGNYLENK
jgi:hypothetical protein